MTKKQKALKIISTVCKTNKAEEMYEDLLRIKIQGQTAIDIMIDFFKPVSEGLWPIHFMAFHSYCRFLLDEEAKRKKDTYKFKRT